MADKPAPHLKHKLNVNSSVIALTQLDHMSHSFYQTEGRSALTATWYFRAFLYHLNNRINTVNNFWITVHSTETLV